VTATRPNGIKISSVVKEHLVTIVNITIVDNIVARSTYGGAGRLDKSEVLYVFWCILSAL